MNCPWANALSLLLGLLKGSPDEAIGYILATCVGGETLSHSHGFPLRLVAPGKRGF